MTRKNSQKEIKMKIKVLKYGSGGPGIFLTRLERELEKRGLIDNLNPDVIISSGFVRTKKKLILRLDTINFEKFTAKAFSGFLRYRVRISFLAALNDVFSALITEKAYNKIITPFLTRFLFYLMNKKQIRGIKRADCVVYMSHFSRNSYKYFCRHYGEEKNKIIFNGADLNQFFPKTGAKEGGLRLLSSGDFRPLKRLQDSLILLREIIKVIPDAKLMVAGKVGPQVMEHLEAIMERNNLREHVEFLGEVHFDQLPSSYSNAHIFLHPSWHDACPNVVVESLACGTPVVCSGTGTAEMVGGGGIVVDEGYNFGFKEYYNFDKIPPLDYNKYLQAVLKIYNNLDYYSRKARQRAEEKFDIKKIADQYSGAAEQVFSK